MTPTEALLKEQRLIQPAKASSSFLHNIFLNDASIILIKLCAKAPLINCPRKNAGATNQKPLTIKPYPMKIRNEFNSKQRLKWMVWHFLDIGQSCFYHFHLRIVNDSNCIIRGHFEKVLQHINEAVWHYAEYFFILVDICMLLCNAYQRTNWYKDKVSEIYGRPVQNNFQKNYRFA